MAERLRLRILTPAREVLARDVDSVNLTAAEGEVGILPGHAPFLAQLRPGVASYRDGGSTEYLALSDGFLEVNEDVVTALVQAAEPAREIDVARAERRREAQEAALKQGTLDQAQLLLSELSLQKQLVRVNVARLHGG